VIKETKGSALDLDFAQNIKLRVYITRDNKRKRKEQDAEAAGGSNSASNYKVGKCSICDQVFTSERGFAIHIAPE
jgi:hypothetical protein